MKLTKTQLRKIIKEELTLVLREAYRGMPKSDPNFFQKLFGMKTSGAGKAITRAGEELARFQKRFDELSADPDSYSVEELIRSLDKLSKALDGYHKPGAIPDSGQKQEFRDVHKGVDDLRREASELLDASHAGSREKYRVKQDKESLANAARRREAEREREERWGREDRKSKRKGHGRDLEADYVDISRL